MLTLCPYSLKPIVDLPVDDVNNEHIIPSAMGGSNQFVLRTHKQANCDFGRTVDSDLIHDPLLRSIAAALGVRSRSKSNGVTSNITGNIFNTGEKIFVEFNKQGMIQHMKESYLKDDKGRLVGIQGFDGQFERNLKNIKKSYLFGKHEKIKNPVCQLKITSDLLNVSKGLAKIAYLMCCRTFGDKFILSSDAQSYKKAIYANNLDDFDMCGLKLWGSHELPLIFLPRIDTHQHLVACFRIGSSILTTIMLFGGIVTSTFEFSIQDYTIKDFDGSVVINDSLERKITEKFLQQYVSIKEMIQKMTAFKANS